ncbi:MAG: lantibiotic immunity ABC transporter MutE/EpiE family permease subunit [Clostridiaceae bacterium]
MLGYLLSENIKIRRTFLKKFIWIAPMLTMLLSLFLARDYFQIDSYNWWYVMMLPGTVSLSCSLLSRVDGSMKNRSVMSLPVNLKKLWVAKVLIGIKNLVTSCMIIFIVGQLISLFIHSNTMIKIPFLNGLWGTLLLIITFMWQVPLCMFLGNKIGLFPTTLLNVAANILFGVMAVEKFWWIVPFSYPARLMCPVLRILPNGLLAQPGSQTFTPELLNYLVIPFASVISLILFIGVTYLTAKWFDKQEAV